MCCAALRSSCEINAPHLKKPLIALRLLPILRDVDGRMLLDIFDEKLHPLSVRSATETEPDELLCARSGGKSFSDTGDVPRCTENCSRVQCILVHWPDFCSCNCWKWMFQQENVKSCKTVTNRTTVCASPLQPSLLHVVSIHLIESNSQASKNFFPPPSRSV